VECKTLDAIVNGFSVYKDKRKFESFALAKRQENYINGLSSTINKVLTYKCTKCDKHHIGRKGKQIKLRKK